MPMRSDLHQTLHELTALRKRADEIILRIRREADLLADVQPEASLFYSDAMRFRHSVEQEFGMRRPRNDLTAQLHRLTGSSADTVVESQVARSRQENQVTAHLNG